MRDIRELFPTDDPVKPGATAKYSLKTLASGTHTITAIYGGDGNNEPSESAGFTETIEP